MNPNDDLEKLFAAARASEPYIPDTGFSTQVMQAVRPRKRLSPWVANAILLLATLLACLIFALSAPVAQYVALLPKLLTQTLSIALFALGNLLLAAGVTWMAKTNRV